MNGYMMTKYTKVEVDLDKCSLSTVFELFIYSKVKPDKNDRKQKELMIRAFVLEMISKYADTDFKKQFIEEAFKNNDKKQS